MYYTTNYDIVYNSIHNFIISIHNLVNNDKIINFSIVLIINLKIVCLIKSPIIICGIFSEDTMTPIIKLYLMHIYISFINFTGPSLPAVLYNISNNETSEHNKRFDINNSKYFKIKLYEVNLIYL